MNARENVSVTLRVPCGLAEKLLSEFDPGLSTAQRVHRVESVGTAYSWDESLKLV